ncbi:alpha-1,2-mannosyltransferase ALG9-like [Styela clava]|uniref:alpha-1,2-mannosyltransferase ALG9-like n=1 Tax=Styela clava TaxID=7725 RepID=UPI001939F3AD|nr:alpha-1,2-mannosyltransferase ALG9-like [Styela clava]
MKVKPNIYVKTAPQEDESNPPSADKNPYRKARRTTEIWLPEASTAFKFFMSANLASALLSNISDCDETFNYWEPLHYLMYGNGFQTWEYSPAYAIRSWSYIRLHSILTWAHLNLFNSNKLLVFYFIRAMLALFCSLSEVHFYKGVALMFGGNVARMLLVFLTFGSGMFISAVAFLPSSFCMYMTFLTFGSWMQGQLHFAVLSVAAGAIIGWPFSAALGIPLAIDILLRRRSYFQFAKWCFVALVTMLLPCMAIDSYYYGKPVIASLNIVHYNVFTQHGPDIYGVQPLSYYLLNGFLNFNLAFILAILSGGIVFISELLIMLKIKGYKPAYIIFLLFLTPMYIWVMIFFSQPHKEERFLFPIYPLICLSASIAVATVQKLYCVFKLHDYLDSRWMSLSTLGIYIILSLSRSIALFQAYHAPLEVYPSLMMVSENRNYEHPNMRVCVGKEWYRYPSSFFLPANFSMEFIQSDFRAQLPSHFVGLPPEGSRHIPTDMNDANLEETSRYVDSESCHFLVDLSISKYSINEPNYALHSKNWKLLKSVAFLDVSQSHNKIFRAFYIPYIFETRNQFGNYVLLQSKKNKLPEK